MLCGLKNSMCMYVGSERLQMGQDWDPDTPSFLPLVAASELSIPRSLELHSLHSCSSLDVSDVIDSSQGNADPRGLELMS